MLKKLLTGCLTIAMVSAFSASVMAADMMDGAKVTGKVRAYFGQFTPAGDIATSHFKNAAEGNIGVMGTVGDITGFIEFQANDGSTSEFKDTKVWAQMNKGALSLKIGNDADLATVAFIAVGKTSDLAQYGGAWADAGNGGYIEDDNLRVGYQVGDLNLGLSLYSWDTTTGQSATQLTANGKVGPVDLRVAITNKSFDDPNTDADDSDKDLAQSHTKLGVKYPIGNMAIEFSYATTAAKTAADLANDTTWMRLGFSMSGAGPGSLSAVYDSQVNSIDGETGDSQTWLNLGYDIPMGQGSGLEIVYLTTTVTAGDASTDPNADALTMSFIGLGLYAFF
jgi:hypothetical protein